MIFFKKIYFKLKFLFYSKINQSSKYVNSYYKVKLYSNWNDQTFKFCYRGDYGNFYSNYLLKYNSNFIFVDIGANQGLYSIIAGKNKNNIKVFSFEPQKKIIQVLEKNLKINNLKKFEILPFALSNIKTKRKLYNFIDHSGKSSLSNKLENSSKVYEEVETVDSETIKYIFEHNEKYIIKIDVEGHEEVVIRELIKLRNFKKIVSVFYEVNSKWIDPLVIKNLLTKEGFNSFIKVGKSASHYDVLAIR